MQSIEEVLAQLDQVIVQARAQQSRTAFFAILYRHMTAAVLRGVQ